MTKLQAPTVAHWPRSVWTSVSSCCQSSSVGPSLRWPNDNLQYPLLLLRVHLLYSIGGNATSTSSRPTPVVVPRRSGLAVPAVSVPSTFMSTLWLRHTPRTSPGPQSSNYIHSVLRLSGSRGSNSVHLSLRTGCDSSQIEPAAFFSSRLCRGHLHPCRLVSVLPDRRPYLRSVTGWLFSISLSLPVSDPRRRCMYGPRRLPDGSGISEFPRACWAPAMWSGRREKD